MLLSGASDPALFIDLEKIKSMANRIVKIIKGLKTISRNGEKDPFETIEINQIIEDCKELCYQKFLTNSVELNLNIRTGMKIQCRPTEMSQVIINLLNNAFDAIEKLPEKWITIETKLFNQETVDIIVTDSGNGIPLEIRDKLMTPFFTTKAAGKGTGIGLNLSQKILHAHGGSISIDDTCKNTRFVIRLPVAKSACLAS